MEDYMTLYHGSPSIICEPAYGLGRKNNDYGQGFYCTESEELAKEWACTSLKGGFANRYSIDISDLNVLNLNSEEYTLLNWIAVLVTHRLFRPRTPIAGRAKKYLQEHFFVNVDAYDLIRGYRADDAYYDFADAFINNGITISQLSKAMMLGKLGEQVVLKSAYAFQKVRYEGYSVAEREIWYPARKARSDEAEKDFFALSSEIEDGLFMADIIREKVTNDDPRIPRNVS